MSEIDNNAIIEEFIYNYPVCEFYSIKHSDLIFSDKVRFICETECTNYNKTWACPPNIGSIEDCMKECEEYDHVFLFTTVAEVSDSLNLTETLAARKDHEEITRAIRGEFRKRFKKTMALSSGCLNCETCAFPNEPCRHPEDRTSTIESHGILIIQVADQLGISYDVGSNMVTYFSLIFYS